MRAIALKRIQKEYVMADHITIYSTGTCPRCERSKELMKKWGVPYQEMRVDQDRDALKEMLERTDHARTVPQIFLGERHIGGLDDLTEAHMDGDLDALLGKA
jgi:glutaredoxin 3